MFYLSVVCIWQNLPNNTTIFNCIMMGKIGSYCNQIHCSVKFLLVIRAKGKTTAASLQFLLKSCIMPQTSILIQVFWPVASLLKLMKMKRNVTLVACFTITLASLFSACDKDEELKTEVPSKTDLLTSGQWKITAYTLTPPMDLNGDGTPDSDGLAAMEACQRDNLFIFSKNGTLTTDEGSTKCDPDDPQQEPSTWSFQNNETEIVIDEVLGVLQELTQSRMRVQVHVGGSKGDFTFTKQ
jgi:hypothetical protein